MRPRSLRMGAADAALIVAALLNGRLALRHYQQLETLTRHRRMEPAGHVTIVIPARNEEQRIGPLLDSLRMQTYTDMDVLVVDDNSDDTTVAVAERMGATVIPAGTLPHGWTGKCHACARGAATSTGEWILFTDADTVHAPDTLAAAIEHARTHNLDFLSLLARQTCETLWEDLLLPYAYFGYFTGSAPGPDAPVMNGQYILCTRAAYDRVGGHTAVRDSVIEDVALARHATRAGATVALLRGETLVSVRMYDSLRALWEGFTKNAARFVRLDPLGGLATALSGIIFLAMPIRAVRARSWPSRLTLALAPMMGLWSWRRSLGLGPWQSALYPIPAAAFQIIALVSLAHSLVPGHAQWRGRRY